MLRPSPEEPRRSIKVSLKKGQTLLPTQNNPRGTNKFSSLINDEERPDGQVKRSINNKKRPDKQVKPSSGKKKDKKQDSAQVYKQC